MKKILIFIVMLAIMAVPISASLFINFDQYNPAPNAQAVSSFLVSTNISGTEAVDQVDFHFYRNGALVANYTQLYSITAGQGQVGVGVYNPSVNFTGAVNGTMNYDAVAYGSGATVSTTGNRTIGLCVLDYVCSTNTCLQSKVTQCTAVSETNCGLSGYYTGNYSEFSVACIPVAPAEAPGSGYTIQSNITSGNGNITNVTDLVIIAPSSAAVIDFTGESVNMENFTGEEITISNNEVYIDTVLRPELNKPATITMTGFLGAYTIYRVNSYGVKTECLEPTCIVQSFDGSTLVFNVTGFSGYVGNSYVKSDMIKIVEDGIGTFFAAIVSYVELAVIAGVLFLGAYVVTKYKR
jgi:hypothetical protein